MPMQRDAELPASKVIAWDGVDGWCLIARCEKPASFRLHQSTGLIGFEERSARRHFFCEIFEKSYRWFHFIWRTKLDRSNPSRQRKMKKRLIIGSSQKQATVEVFKLRRTKPD
jgi:hypothetical protein